jgi:hypothetical protein
LNESLWLDELWSTHVKLGNVFLLGYQVLYDPHPPFYYVFMFLWIKLFGDSELSIRIPPLIFGILSILLTYALALRFAGKKEALLASFLLCVSPVHIWYSDEARPYSATLFFLLLSIFSYYKLKNTKESSIWYFVYFIALLFAVFSHYYVVVYLGIISIMCVLKFDKIKRKVLILNILILASFISFLGLKSLFGEINMELGHLRPFTLYEFWMLFFNWFIFGNSIWNINPYGNDINLISDKPLMFATQIVFYALFIHGVMQIFRESKKRENSDTLDLLFYVFPLPLFILGLDLIGFKKIYIERSVFVVLPFFYIILIKGITGVKARSVSLACTIFIVIFSIIALTSFFKKSNEWTVYQPKPDWPAAVRYFNDEQKNTKNRFFALSTTIITNLTYYDSRFEEYEFSGMDLSDSIIRKLKRLLGEHNYLVKKLSFDLRKYIQAKKDKIANSQFLIFYPNEDEKKNIYMILSSNNVKTFYLIERIHWPGSFKRLFESIIMDSRFQLVSTQTFKGIKIYKFNVVSQ